jgi:transcriptional regulator with XRE-family HTH domain
MSKNKLGKKIKEFREFRQITRDDLALKANLDNNQLEKIEEMGLMPSLGHLIKIRGLWGYESEHFSMTRIRLGR